MTRSRGPRVLFICGSVNQTSQLHAIARELPEVDARFSPYYGDRAIELLRRAGVLEGTIAGDKLTLRCLEYLERERLTLDRGGVAGSYDLVVTCSDVVVPKNVRGTPIVAVQEGILDPDGVLWELVRRFPRVLPRWLAGTAASGLSGAYEHFCVASPGYRELFIERGAPPERVVATGIPNFDDCRAFLDNDFPHRDYVLICSSDTRETFKFDSRRQFWRWAKSVAGNRRTLIRLHPNEKAERSTRELREFFPEADVYTQGRTEAMIANCDVLITQYSSTAFTGLALGKEVHSYHSIETLKRLVPLQNRSAARNIADVCRKVLWHSRAKEHLTPHHQAEARAS
jgi:hypothetical protein